MKTFEIDAVIEIPSGSSYKYEIDKIDGKLKIDRPLLTTLPYNYGYVPNTLHEGDGDPLDVCVIGPAPIYPLTKVKLTVLGAFKCIDNGESDDKLVCVVKGAEQTVSDGSIWDPGLMTDINPLEFWKKTISDYLSTYKEGFVVNEFVGPEEAQQILMKDIEAYINA